MDQMPDLSDAETLQAPAIYNDLQERGLAIARNGLLGKPRPVRAFTSTTLADRWFAAIFRIPESIFQ
jgi:hypothetical protein